MELNTKFNAFEYRKHIKNYIFPNSILGILLLMFLVLINSFVFGILNPLMENINYIAGEYDHVVVSNSDHWNYKHIYQFPDLVTVSSEINKRLNVNTYMLNSGDSTVMYDDAHILKQDEIVVSEKVADKLNVSVGDTVCLDFSLSEVPKMYKVVGIIPFVWNYYDIENNSDFSVVQVGYDETLAANYRLLSTYFLNNNEFGKFIDENNSYIRHYDIVKELDDLSIKKWIVLCLSFILSAMVSLGFLIRISKVVKTETVKYFRNGFAGSIVLLFHLVDYLILFGIPQLLFALYIVIIGIVFHTIYLVLLSIVFIDLLLLIFSYMKEIKVYGKTN